MNPAGEWLEADGLGGFAMGRADLVRTRRYHALLTTATTPPTGRVTLVNGFEAFLDTDEGRVPLTSQRYVHDVTHPDGAARIETFTTTPWPTWTYRLPGGARLVHELVALHGSSLVALSWRLSRPARGRLVVRLLLSGRDVHASHHENDVFGFEAVVSGPRITWEPYVGLPPVVAVTNGEYTPHPLWYRQFQLDEERARGLGFVEDLASPGTLTFQLEHGRAILALGSGGEGRSDLLDGFAERLWATVEGIERKRRNAFASPLHRAASAYLVRRGKGKTIIAGYPWFSDWGRDTFIALRGLCIAGDRLDDARDILLEWSQHVSEGMLPNFFPDGDAPVEYNSVDASLWYVIAAHELLAHARADVSHAQRAQLHEAIDAIVAGYARGTRHEIRAAESGLLSAGAPGVQLTWMDARIGDWVVTPRAGKPVEVQALWINALRIAGQRDPRWAALAARAAANFLPHFWNAAGYLNDVVDVDHRPGLVDTSFRPNQLLALGGLPFSLVEGRLARDAMALIEARLWTAAGPRSLAPDEPAYAPRYEGDMRARDAVYHQGTVWPWLAGAFVEAWVRVRGHTAAAREEARTRFFDPLVRHYARDGLGHLSEIADGDSPHAPRGCPFQAWSVGEALRLDRDVLCGDEARGPFAEVAVLDTAEPPGDARPPPRPL
ncbi:MAG: amylo-alpha-1,6-glucosidase [Gemmatimonadaceae bacterium]